MEKRVHYQLPMPPEEIEETKPKKYPPMFLICVGNCSPGAAYRIMQSFRRMECFTRSSPKNRRLIVWGPVAVMEDVQYRLFRCRGSFIEHSRSVKIEEVPALISRYLTGRQP